MRFSFDTKVSHCRLECHSAVLVTVSMLVGEFGGIAGLRPITAEVGAAATALAAQHTRYDRE